LTPHSAAIDSIQNPLIRRLKQLQANSRARRKQNALVVEGSLYVTRAIGSRDYQIDTLVYCEDLFDSDDSRLLVERLRAENARSAQVTRKVFEHVSERNNPDGMAAILSGGRAGLDLLDARKTDVFVCLSDISDPGNLGTILRTMDSAGASACILVGESTDPYHPRAIRASRGSLFSLRIVHAGSMAELWAWARRHEAQTVATSARGGQCYWTATYSFPLLLILGSEHEGLPRDTLDAADQTVTIPMWGEMSSLNVGVAASLLLYEIRRRAELM